MKNNGNQPPKNSDERSHLSSAMFESYVPRLLEQVNDLIVSLSPDAKHVLYANSTAETIYGRTLNEIIENENLWLDCIHDEDRDSLLKKIQRIEQDKSFTNDFRIVQPSGETRYLQGDFRCINDDHGKLVAIGCIAKDVTNRILAEHQLDEAKAIYHSLVESLPINVFRKDRQGRILYANQRYCESFGLDHESLIGKSDFDLFEPELAEKYLRDDRWVLQTGLPFHDIEAHQTDDNEIRYVEVLKAPVTSSQGRRIGIQGMFWDVTDRKKAELEMERAKDMAIAASQAKSDFLANVSHEIRTPLNAVIGMTDLLLGYKTEATQREYLQMIQDSGQSLLTLINDILDFSKIESGKLDVDSEWFDLREKLGDTLRTLAFKAHSKNIELICNIDPETPGPLLGDPQRLRQVIVNLVGNSIKFTHEGEITVDVELVNENSDSVDLKFRIQDTGIGIAGDKLSQIFEEFVQGDTSTTRQYGGTGLGLTIASSLVELMGGQLEVSSQVDVGTEFHFQMSFPISSNSNRPVIPNEFSDIPILVMAANASNLDSLSCILKSWRMQPYCVRDIDQAIKLAKGMTFAKTPIQIVLAETSESNVEDNCDGALLASQMAADEEITDPFFISLCKASTANRAQEQDKRLQSENLLQPVKYSELKHSIARCLEPATEPASVAQAYQAVSKGPFNILLAEDNPINQKLAVGVLSNHGHKVTVVDNGRKAVDTLQQQTFDVVLMDIQMPEMDGIEATCKIRELEANSYHKTPIVAMTAHAMAADRQRCLEAGMDEYISKPFRAAELIALLENLLTNRSTESPSSSLGRAAQPTDVFIDWNAAFETVGGDRKLLRELIDVFLAEKDAMLKEMGKGIAEDDFESTRRMAHSLKGTFSHLGVNGLAKTAETMEQLDNSELDRAASLFDELQSKIKELTMEFQRFKNS